MYTYHSQNDARWADKRFSQANLRMGDWGCLNTVMLAQINWMEDEMKVKRTSMDEFLKKARWTSSGLFIWDSVPSPAKFVYRYGKYDRNKVLEILKSKWNCASLEVQWGRQRHWVGVVGATKNDLIVHDAWDGLKKNLSQCPFSAVLGMAEITKK